ncbi:MAG: Erythromycin esterase [Ferruginibacter sp.]|nr:Erythromycin esterase [Ferruginibacter sp.]
MVKCWLFVIGLLSLQQLPAQDLLKQYVQRETKAIRSNQPDSLDFTDLDVIGNAIGNSRIIMLGEQDHGDAPAFLAKTRLIKYLHEKKGFNVLAFESDFFGLNKGWDKLPKEKRLTDSFLMKNIFPIWTFCDACADLFYKYIPATQQTTTPIQMTGFDNQMVLSYSGKNLSKQVDSILRLYDLPITKEANYITGILPLIDSLKKYKMADTTQYQPQYEYLLRIKKELSAKLAADDFWMMIIDNLISENIQYRDSKDYIFRSNTRDLQMAKNLEWLAKKKYPQEKIIVWAHNYHISKYSGHYEQRFRDRSVTMGTIFDATDLSSQTYTLGFTSYEGTAGRLSTKPYKVPKPAKKSFENWINKDYAFAFTDFKTFNLANPGYGERFKMKGSVGVHHATQEAEWHKIFDGIFFVRTMYPCVSNLITYKRN